VHVFHTAHTSQGVIIFVMWESGLHVGTRLFGAIVPHHRLA
jgi:hypothetical protein